MQQMTDKRAANQDLPTDTPARMLWVFPSDRRGGAEEYALTIAFAAEKTGAEVAVAFPHTRGNASLIEDCRQHQCRCFDLQIAESDIDSIHGEYIERILALYASFGPDVVHLVLPWPTFGFSTMIASTLAKIPTLVTFQLARENRPLNAAKRAIADMLDRNYVHVSTASCDTQRIVGQMFGWAPETINVIHNGVSIPCASFEETQAIRAQTRETLRAKLGLSLYARIFLTVGRLEEQKGHRYLIPVIEHLVERDKQTCFLWVGDGMGEEELAKILTERGIRDNVVFTGYQRDVWPYLYGADIFVFPTLYEGFGFSLAEAMAAGLPAIASNVSAIPEFLLPGCGLLVPPADSEASLEAATFAIENPAEMQAMAEKAYEHIQCDFSRETMVRRTIALIRSLSRGDQ